MKELRAEEVLGISLHGYLGYGILLCMSTKAKAKVTEVAVVVPQNVSIEAVIQNAIDKGVPVETMERLLGMRRELKAEAAKESYNRAMADFQAECPTIVKTKGVTTRDGDIAYKYAPIESIVSQVQPYLQKYGFSFSTTMELKENGVRVVCKVTHRDGHSEESPMEVPLGTKTQIMSDTQVTAAASTFAKRYAFCNAFGILTGDEDNDAVKPRRDEPAMAPYTVKKATTANDDAQDGQRDKIKELLSLLGKKHGTLSEATAAVKLLTKYDLKPENFPAIITILKEKLEATDPIAQVLNNKE